MTDLTRAQVEKLFGDPREVVQMQAVQPDLSVPQNLNEYIASMLARLEGVERERLEQLDLLRQAEACRAERDDTLIRHYQAQLATVQARVRELEVERDAALYIPGSWACTQCEFGQVITNLYVNTGTVGPNTDEVPICPNDGSLMRRSTWKERVKDGDKYITDMLNERDTLTTRLTQAEHDAKGARECNQRQAEEITELRRDRTKLEEALKSAPTGVRGESHGDVIARYYAWYEGERQQAIHPAQEGTHDKG